MLPAPYSDAFYTRLASKWPEDNPFVKMAYHNDVLVGAICSRLEIADPSQINPDSATAQDNAESKSVVGTSSSTAGAAAGGGGKKKGGKKEAEKPQPLCVYLMTLGVLAPYRRRGIAEKLLKLIIKNAEAIPAVEYVYLHVHVGNKEAASFYTKHGFTHVGTTKGYYKQASVTPPDADIYVYHVKKPEA